MEKYYKNVQDCAMAAFSNTNSNTKDVSKEIVFINNRTVVVRFMEDWTKGSEYLIRRSRKKRNWYTLAWRPIG